MAKRWGHMEHLGHFSCIHVTSRTQEEEICLPEWLGCLLEA